MSGARPGEDVGVFVVGGVFAVDCAVGVGAGPRVFGGRVEAGPGEVEAVGGGVDNYFWFEAREDAQGLCVAFEAAGGGFVEGVLAVVAVGRVADVVGEAGHFA